MYALGISTFILLLILIYYINNQDNESNYVNNEHITKPTIECVIARYNESINWINMPQFDNVSKFIIYNKGTKLNIPLRHNAIEISIPNVGKCDHTFLYHIINNYNNLADITLFASGRADDSRKGPKIIKTMNLINETHNSVFIGHPNIIPDDMYNFTIDKWISTNPENQVGEGTIAETNPAIIRPFGKWFNNYWPNKKINIFVVQSTFAVHKQHICQHPISYYTQFYEQLNDSINPEAGHFIERSWGMIFSPFPNRCKYFEIH